MRKGDEVVARWPTSNSQTKARKWQQLEPPLPQFRLPHFRLPHFGRGTGDVIAARNVSRSDDRPMTLTVDSPLSNPRRSLLSLLCSRVPTLTTSIERWMRHSSHKMIPSRPLRPLSSPKESQRISKNPKESQRI